MGWWLVGRWGGGAVGRWGGGAVGTRLLGVGAGRLWLRLLFATREVGCEAHGSRGGVPHWMQNTIPLECKVRSTMGEARGARGAAQKVLRRVQWRCSPAWNDGRVAGGYSRPAAAAARLAA